MNDTIHRFLDIQMPLDKIASLNLAEAGNHIQAFTDALTAKEQATEDV